MKRVYAAAVLSLFAAGGYFAVGAYAQDRSSGGPTMKERATTFCTREARSHGLSGDKRKAFVKSCIAKAPDCVKKTDEMKITGMEYIDSVAKCVAQ